MTQFFIPKRFFQEHLPSAFWAFSLLLFFLLAAQSTPIRLAEDRVPTLRSFEEISVFDAVRPVRSNFQFSFRVLKFYSTIDEDFDGDDEAIPSACLEICDLLVPSDLCEILIPETRVEHVQHGIVLILFDRPPPSLTPETPTA